jgi:hypothetical protein
MTTAKMERETMYRANEGHLQQPLFSDLDQLSDKARKRLETSWAGAFYREFFSRLDETGFAELYSEQPSRPAIAINVLVSLESLKAGFGWSDQEMHDNFLFNTQVRYAVGYHNLGEGEFELRTVIRDKLRDREKSQIGKGDKSRRGTGLRRRLTMAKS